MTKPIIRRIAYKAIPACIVAGLGIGVQVSPALAESPAISTTEEDEAVKTESTCTGIAKDTKEPTNHDTLADALRKNYSYIQLNRNVTENIRMTENSELDPYYQDTIVMNGHKVEGTDQSTPTLYNESRLELRTEVPWDVDLVRTSKLSSAAGKDTNPVIYNGPKGELDTRNIDVTGIVENNGFLRINGGTFSGSIVNHGSANGDGGSIYILDGDFTSCNIEEINGEDGIMATGGTFSSSLTKDDMIGLLTESSCVKQNDNGTWTVYQPLNEKLQEGDLLRGHGRTAMLHYGQLYRARFSLLPHRRQYLSGRS